MSEMSDKFTMFEICARVEAAVAKYLQVRERSDEAVWRKNFESEHVSPSFRRRLHLIQISSP
jgi:hypothetical protein